MSSRVVIRMNGIGVSVSLFGEWWHVFLHGNDDDDGVFLGEFAYEHDARAFAHRLADRNDWELR